MAARKGNSKTPSQNIFAEVRTRYNKAGRYYNARFMDEVQSIPSLEAMQDALNVILNRDNPVVLRAKNDAQVQKSGDHIGSVWVDLYPKIENPFAVAAALKAEVAS